MGCKGVYTDNNLIMPEIDSEGMDMSTQARFDAGADIIDGCSGKLTIDTRFENFSESDVENPTNKDAPRQVNKWDHPHRQY